MGYFILTIIVIIIILLVSFMKQINEYERGILFTFGRFTKIIGPGWHVVLPIVQFHKKIDIRVKVDDVPFQEAITKDNISVRISAVIYYKIQDAKKVVLEVENYAYAVAQLAQTTMRNMVGSITLDSLLAEREQVADEIKNIIKVTTDGWGVEVVNVELRDIALPEEMKRVIATVAEAQREKQAIIIKSEGEVEASKNLAEASIIMNSAPGSMHLRTLSSLCDVATDKANTIVFTLPVEVLKSFESISGVASAYINSKKDNNQG